MISLYLIKLLKSKYPYEKEVNMGDIIDFKEKTERIIKEKERLKEIKTIKNILKRIKHLTADYSKDSSNNPNLKNKD